MITEMVSYIPIWETLLTFGFFTILLLIMIIYSRLHWGLKAAITGLSSLVFVLAHLTLQNSLGWPYKGVTPKQFQILWVDVTEPTEETEGGIRYWMRAQPSPIAAPRVYERPYTKPGHHQAQDIQRKLKAGLPIFGKSEIPGEDGANKRGNPHDHANTHDDTNGIEIIEASIPLPSKHQE